MLSALIEKSEKLAKILCKDIRLVPQDGSDKWINIKADSFGCRGFQYGNAEVVIKPSPNPFFADEILIINSRRMDTFMKKLSKYEDLKGKEWQLDDGSFNCVTGIAEELHCWIQDYLEANNLVVLSTRGKKK